MATIRRVNTFKVKHTEIIDFKTLLEELSNQIEIPIGEEDSTYKYISKNSKIGRQVATLLDSTTDRDKPIIEQINARELLTLNHFSEWDCSSRRTHKKKLRETCQKFCSKKESKLNVPPTGSDFVHLNLGKYCWQIVSVMTSKCRQWYFADLLEDLTPPAGGGGGSDFKKWFLLTQG